MEKLTRADATKIIFLDIDGPMIPLRAYSLPENRDGVGSKFDPIAAAMVERLATDANAKIVISSVWRSHGHAACRIALRVNGIRSRHLHSDWKTTVEFTSKPRAEEIGEWLGRHPEVTQWIALDDEPVPEPNGVQCTMEDGLGWKHYQKARILLGLDGLP